MENGKPTVSGQNIVKKICQLTLGTVFENHPKSRIFGLLKLTMFGVFNELLSTHNVNVARFARNVEWDLFWIFKHR